MVITKFDTKLGDIFITKFGDHQIYHKIKHKFLWKFGQQFVDFIQWHISHRIFWSPNLSPYSAPNLMFTQFGDQFITKFGDKIGDHHIWHLIRWQICHQIWWTPNMSPNNSPNLVTNLSPKRVLTDFVTKFVTIFCTKFGNHRICHRIWWQIWCQICHQTTLGSYLPREAGWAEANSQKPLAFQSSMILCCDGWECVLAFWPSLQPWRWLSLRTGQIVEWSAPGSVMIKLKATSTLKAWTTAFSRADVLLVMLVSISSEF